MSPTVYLITGAGRGIGFEIISQLSKRQDVIVFAGVRSLPKAGDQLSLLAEKFPEIVFPVKITSANEEDNRAAAKYVEEKVGKVDVIIANAGAHSGMLSTLQLTPTAIRSDIETNTIGPVVLFQSFHQLLIKATSKAKFIVISSLAGKITDAVPWPIHAYGASKAAVNYMVKKIDLEFPEIVAFPLHPGIVDTDMGREAAAAVGTTPKDFGAITSEESARGILAVVDAATKETHGGRFWDEKGVQHDY